MPDDPQAGMKVRLETPIENAFAITPNDSTDLAYVTRALWVGGYGDVSVDMKGGEESVVFKGVQGLLPIRVVRVNANGTDASDIVGLY